LLRKLGLEHQLEDFKSRIGLPDDTADTAKVVTDILNRQVVHQEKAQAAVDWPPAGSVLLSVAPQHEATAFLKKRRYSVEQACQHGVAVGLAGRYAGRFIIPIRYGGRVVAFQARDMSGRAEAKYLSEGGVGQYLYGLDDVKLKQDLVIVEGIFDQWRASQRTSGVLASFSHNVTMRQAQLLIQLRPCSVTIAWDRDSVHLAYRASLELLFLGCPVIVMVSNGNDPDTTDPDEFSQACARARLQALVGAVPESGTSTGCNQGVELLVQQAVSVS
jgi:DNA primase